MGTRGSRAIRLLRAGQAVLTPQIKGAWASQAGGQRRKGELRGGMQAAWVLET